MAIMDRVDARIQRDISEPFAWAPEVGLARIGISVIDGGATRFGQIERAASRVVGARSATNAIIAEPDAVAKELI